MKTLILLTVLLVQQTHAAVLLGERSEVIPSVCWGRDSEEALKCAADQLNKLIPYNGYMKYARDEKSAIKYANVRTSKPDMQVDKIGHPEYPSLYPYQAALAVTVTATQTQLACTVSYDPSNGQKVYNCN